MLEITLTTKQAKWLDSRGGRTIADVEADEKGLFVPMSNGNGQKMKVYLPIK